jgi:hypothetical protein
LIKNLKTERDYYQKQLDFLRKELENMKHHQSVASSMSQSMLFDPNNVVAGGTNLNQSFGEAGINRKLN